MVAVGSQAQHRVSCGGEHIPSLDFFFFVKSKVRRDLVSLHTLFVVWGQFH